MVALGSGFAPACQTTAPTARRPTRWMQAIVRTVRLTKGHSSRGQRGWELRYVIQSRRMIVLLLKPMTRGSAGTMTRSTSGVVGAPLNCYESGVAAAGGL